MEYLNQHIQLEHRDTKQFQHLVICWTYIAKSFDLNVRFVGQHAPHGLLIVFILMYACHAL